MIEENLGLREFQIKKEEAKKKLEASQINLEKTEALLEELKPHLRSLRRQINRWEKREEIFQELSSLENSFYSAKFKEIFLFQKQIDQEKIDLEKKQIDEEEKLKILEKKFEELEKRRPDFSQQFQDLRKKISDIEEKRGNLFKELGHLEGQIEGLKRFILVSKPNVNEITQKDLNKKILEIKNQLNEVLSFDLEKTRQTIKEIINQIEKLFNAEEKNNEIEKNQNSEEIIKLQQEKEKILKQVDELTEQIKKYNQELDELRKKDEMVGKDSHDVLLAVQKQRNLINQNNQELANISLKEEKNKLRQADLLMRLKEDNLDVNLFNWEKVKDFDTEKFLAEKNIFNLDNLEARIIHLRRELANIGEIDELTLKEAKETEERYQFLSQQSEDLIKAKNDLESIIAELTEKIDNQFSESLKIINEEFNKYFRMIFGGGKAKLAVVKIAKRQKNNNHLESEKENENKNEETQNENNLPEEESKEFETGLEILVDLPKKKIKSLELLSGGERCLISISALFAIVSAMQPPFVVLDEVDAALDESNARRFAKILADIVDTTQFIVVTHNRATMEMAKILYGISMGEEGISKAISIKLEEEK